MSSENRSEQAPGRRVLVTGGSGFIGTNVVDAFLAHGSPVLNLDAAPPRMPAHRSSWQEADILDAGALRQAFTAFRPDLVVHLAAKTVLNERTDLEHYAANIQGVQNVIEAVQATAGVERTIFASSRLVFRLGHVPKDDLDYNPSTLYGLSKVRGEELVRSAGTALGTWTIVRPTGIWGPWFGVPYRDFFRSIERGTYVHPHGRDARKSYGYVENTVYQLQKLADASPSAVRGRTFILADYPPLSIRSWATQIQEALGARPIRSVPIPILKAAAIAGDGLQRLGLRPAPLTSFRLNNLTSDMLYDTGSLEQLVGPLPFDAAEGVKRTVAWLRQHGAPPH